MPHSLHVYTLIHPAYQNMKLQHIHRFNRGNMDAFYYWTPFFTYFKLILHQYDNMVPIEHFKIPNYSHVYPLIHPAYQNMKLQHIQRFNRGNINVFVFWTPVFTYFQLILHQYYNMLPIEHF